MEGERQQVGRMSRADRVSRQGPARRALCYSRSPTQTMGLLP